MADGCLSDNNLREAEIPSVVLMPANLSTKISAPIPEVVTPTVIFPVNGSVPTPSVDFMVDTPTVI